MKTYKRTYIKPANKILNFIFGVKKMVKTCFEFVENYDL